MEDKHPWLKDSKFELEKKEIHPTAKEILIADNNAYAEIAAKKFVELKKQQIIDKFAKKPEISLYNLEKRGVYKVDNDGNWELVAKCNTHREALDEIEWRAQEFKIEIGKKNLAKTVFPHKGTYVILPVYEIK